MVRDEWCERRGDFHAFEVESEQSEDMLRIGEDHVPMAAHSWYENDGVFGGMKTHSGRQ